MQSVTLYLLLFDMEGHNAPDGFDRGTVKINSGVDICADKRNVEC